MQLSVEEILKLLPYLTAEETAWLDALLLAGELRRRAPAKWRQCAPEQGRCPSIVGPRIVSAIVIDD